MIESLLTLINGMNHTSKKDDVMKSIDTIFNSINDEVIPTLDNLIEIGKYPAIKDDKYLEKLRRKSELRAKDNRDFLVKLKTVFVNINKSYSTVKDVADEVLPKVISDKAITAKQAAMLRIISDTASLGLYAMDLSYYIVMDRENHSLGKARLESIESNAIDFIVYLRIYSDNYKRKVEEVKEVSDEEINTDKKVNVEMLKQRVGKTGKTINLPFKQGFKGNPFYHIGIWLVDREMKRYDALKDKKKLTELKIYDLKQRKENDGENNPELDKQIEYFEERVSNIEYEIAKIEK